MNWPRRGTSQLLVFTLPGRMNCTRVLTSDLEGGVPAAGKSCGTASNTPVDPDVRLLPAVHHPQEEQGAGRQQHTVSRRPNRLSILVPLDSRGRVAVSLTVESGGVVTWHTCVYRVLRDAWRPVLLPCNNNISLRTTSV